MVDVKVPAKQLQNFLESLEGLFGRLRKWFEQLVSRLFAI
jgi:hypothetical protein